MYFWSVHHHINVCTALPLWMFSPYLKMFLDSPVRCKIVWTLSSCKSLFCLFLHKFKCDDQQYLTVKKYDKSSKQTINLSFFNSEKKIFLIPWGLGTTWVYMHIYKENKGTIYWLPSLPISTFYVKGLINYKTVCFDYIFLITFKNLVGLKLLTEMVKHKLTQ